MDPDLQQTMTFYIKFFQGLRIICNYFTFDQIMGKGDFAYKLLDIFMRTDFTQHDHLTRHQMNA